jgi:small subunit ribosomal protein S16
MVKLRLRRVGAKKQASYRIVATDSRSPRDGRFIEVVGFYNPRTEPETVRIKEARALHWLSVGAQPTDAVVRLLKKMGTMDRFERLKKGESIETLVAEAEGADEPVISPKTRRAPDAKKPEEPVQAAVEEESADQEQADETVEEKTDADEPDEEAVDEPSADEPAEEAVDEPSADEPAEEAGDETSDTES